MPPKQKKPNIYTNSPEFQSDNDFIKSSEYIYKTAALQKQAKEVQAYYAALRNAAESGVPLGQVIPYYQEGQKAITGNKNVYDALSDPKSTTFDIIMAAQQIGYIPEVAKATPETVRELRNSASRLQFLNQQLDNAKNKGDVSQIGKIHRDIYEASEELKHAATSAIEESGDFSNYYNSSTMSLFFVGIFIFFTVMLLIQIFSLKSLNSLYDLVRSDWYTENDSVEVSYYLNIARWLLSVSMFIVCLGIILVIGFGIYIITKRDETDLIKRSYGKSLYIIALLVFILFILAITISVLIPNNLQVRYFDNEFEGHVIESSNTVKITTIVTILMYLILVIILVYLIVQVNARFKSKKTTSIANPVASTRIPFTQTNLPENRQASEPEEIEMQEM